MPGIIVSILQEHRSTIAKIIGRKTIVSTHGRL